MMNELEFLNKRVEVLQIELYKVVQDYKRLQNELETLRAQYTAACVELANCGAGERYEARMMAEGKG